MLIRSDELKKMLALAGKALQGMSPADANIEKWAEQLAKDLIGAGEKEYEGRLTKEIARIIIMQ